MGISYWVKGRTQDDTAPVLKPNPRDKNVMPMEMVDYINEHTELSALWRLGGTLDLLKHLVAAGYPVIVEKGFDVAGEGWMGHYELVSGYDDARERFITQDSYISKDLPVPYAQMEREWRAFANVFVVVYPPEKETELMAVLGQYADPTTSYTLSAEQASVNIYALTDPRDIYFAWYAYGTSLMRLQDYNGAAAAYDASFNAYDVIPEDANRPWRMLWYQTGPYFAYYYTGRMADVINLATHTLDIMSEPVLEESYYWRGLALEASGDVNGAIADYRKALEVHTDFGPALTELERLGVSP
jgi:tetratricopeptide (TPR) repeat protein